MLKIIKEKEIILYLILSILFAITIQQFPFFKGNSLHLLHAIKDFDTNKLQDDWIANQTNHLPIFTYLNYFLLKFFPINILHIIHFCLLVSCSLFLFLICKNEFPNLNRFSISIIWFSTFIFIYHEGSLFSGLAGQDVINEGYQPASFGVLFFCGIYLYLKKRYYYAIFFICLSASLHPTYILHSGFLLIGFFLYFLSIKEFKLSFKIVFFYIILISPITLFIVSNFLLIDKELILGGQDILLNRIPHHALIESWFSYKDIISLLIFIISLSIIYKKKVFFIPFAVFGLLAIFFSMVQYFSDSKTLALAFPWRASVFIIPISSMIVFSFLIEKFFLNKNGLKIFCSIFFLIIFSFFFLKNHFVKNLNQNFYLKLELTKKIKENYNFIDRLLIPVNLSYIRMNTGIPIFIDWKHHAFKYSEIIIWRKRVDLAENFYNAKSLAKTKLILKKINEIEKISHILVYKDQRFNNCENLIDDESFLLVDVNKCFNIN